MATQAKLVALCIHRGTIPGCWNNAGVKTPILIHPSYNHLGAPIAHGTTSTDGSNTDIGVVFTDLSNVLITGVDPADVTPGSCSPDGLLYRDLCMCDDVNGDGSVIVPFNRLVEVDPTAGTSTPVGDFMADWSGNYTTQGTSGLCSDLGEAADIREIPMCDQGVNFWRLVDILSHTVVTNYDHTGAYYTPSGNEVGGNCAGQSAALINCVTCP